MVYVQAEVSAATGSPVAELKTTHPRWAFEHSVATGPFPPNWSFVNRNGKGNCIRERSGLSGSSLFFLFSSFFFLLSAFFFLHLASCRVVSCRVVSCRVVSCRPVPCRLVLFLWLYDNLHAGSTYITKQPNLVLAVSSAYVLTSRPVALHR